MDKIKQSGHFLIVDDNFHNRLILSTFLKHEGFTSVTANDGQEALDVLKDESFDCILLDLMMPRMDGMAVLEWLKSNNQLRHVPVIIISALQDDGDMLLKCIEMGAIDYLTKPFDPLLLRARINSALVGKRIRDLEQEYISQIQTERTRSELLLLNILPASVTEKLKQGHRNFVDSYDDATVLFLDLVNFTHFTTQVPSSVVMDTLNAFFNAFDDLVEKHGLEKIKTTGDSYMVAGGVPVPDPEDCARVARMALDMQSACHQLRLDGKIHDLQVRIGFHNGPLLAGVIGRKKFAFDLWGDTVNTASRIEEASIPGKILVSDIIYQRLHDQFQFEARGLTQMKGKEPINTYYLIS